MDLADQAAETSTIYPTQRTPTALLTGLPQIVGKRSRKSQV